MPEDWTEILNAPEREGVSVAEICRRYGIARKTFYAHLARSRVENGAGAAPRQPRPPRRSPRVAPEVVEVTRELRVRNPGWGARRIRAEMSRRDVLEVPAASTIHQILVRAGLITVETRRRVDTHGTISYRGRRIQLGTSVRGQVVTVEQRDDYVRIHQSATLVLRELRLGPAGAYHGNGGKSPGRPAGSR